MERKNCAVELTTMLMDHKRVCAHHFNFKQIGRNCGGRVGLILFTIRLIVYLELIYILCILSSCLAYSVYATQVPPIENQMQLSNVARRAQIFEVVNLLAFIHYIK